MSHAITVGVRMRPLVPHEHGQVPCFELTEPADAAIIPSAPIDHAKGTEGPWRFDFAMDSSDPGKVLYTDNESCYKKMGRPMVEQCLEGYNVCLFCYGQTGTGKTTTIMGDPQNGPGILIKLLGDIFVEARKFREQGATCEVSVQMLEVYNEVVHDLLQDNREVMLKTKVNVHLLPSGVSIQGAVSKPVETMEDCTKLIEHGNDLKTIAATAMNPQSSRGHTIFKLLLHKSGGLDGQLLDSEVYFADLAGHENEKTTHVTGERLKELTFINKSLMWLQNAIHSLGKPHKGKADMGVFRNSKLTLILSPALTGNSRTAIIVTLSPAAAHFDTSLSSIKFAVESKSIKIDAKASKSLDPNVRVHELEAEVKELRVEARELKQKLEIAEAGGGGATSSASADGADELRRGYLRRPSGASQPAASLTLQDQDGLRAACDGQAAGQYSDSQYTQVLLAENHALRQELAEDRSFGAASGAAPGVNGSVPPRPSGSISADFIRDAAEQLSRCLEISKKTSLMVHSFAETKQPALSSASGYPNGDARDHHVR